MFITVTKHKEIMNNLRAVHNKVLAEHIEIEKELRRKIDTLDTKLTEVEGKYKEREVLALKAADLEYKARLQDAKAAIQEEYNNKTQASLEKDFDKLKESLTRLHEEGNSNTKYLEKVSLKLMDSIRPSNTKQLE